MSNIKKILALSFLTIPYALESNDCCPDACAPISQNLWQPHAFSAYASREILIMKGLDVDQEKDHWISRFGFTTEYMQNFRNQCQGLGALPFWSGTNTMTIGDNSGDYDLDAYQFGMGDIKTNSEGKLESGAITLNPKIQQAGTEFLWWLQQYDDKPGVYCKVKMPVGAMIMNNRLCEDPATLSYANVYVEHDNFDRDGRSLISPEVFYPTLSAAFASGLHSQDPIFEFGRITCCQNSSIKLGDISVVVGGNFVASENGHAGLGFKVSCPTGTVPTAKYVLEPIFGRAGHWGVGAEFYAHYKHNNNDDGTKYWTFWVQSELMHLFSGRKPSWRSFDLAANGPGSKYLLLQRYAYEGAITNNSPSNLHPAINLTTLPVISTFDLEGNCAMMIDCHNHNWNVGLAVEFWARTRESLAIDNCRALQDRDNALTDYNLNHYVVLGRQIGNIGGSRWCEPLARINKSAPRQLSVIEDAYKQQVKSATDDANRIPADYEVALDICGATAPQIFTGKILGEFGYTWEDKKTAPHVSVFGAVELAGSDKRAANLWSVGLQGSVQF